MEVPIQPSFLASARKRVYFWKTPPKKVTTRSQSSSALKSGASIRILFVCLGNICRSPAAEGVMKRMVARRNLEKRVEIASAGTIGMHEGDLPDTRMRSAARRRGIQLTSRARQIEVADFERFDLIITMDRTNFETVSNLAPETGVRAEILPFCSFLTEHSEQEVPDPYYGGTTGFERVLNLLEDGCRGLLEEVEHRLNVSAAQ